MSNYRHDDTDTLRISDSLSVGTVVRSEDNLKIKDSLKLKISIRTTDTITIADESTYRHMSGGADIIHASDSSIGFKGTIVKTQDIIRAKDTVDCHTHVLLKSEDKLRAYDAYAESAIKAVSTDTISISDSQISHKHGASMVIDALSLIDTYRLRRKSTSLSTDTIKVSDSYSGLLTIRSSDVVKISDASITARHSVALSTDTIKVKDASTQRFTVTQIDAIKIKDSSRNKLKAVTKAADLITISDFIYVPQRQVEESESKLTVNDESLTALRAINYSYDTLFIDDFHEPYKTSGRAWTANNANWAMSRYSDYDFDDISVINGMVVGTNADGVFAIDTVSELDAHVITGAIKLDGALTHPLAAYLNYSFDGDIDVDVTETQTGVARTYTYRVARRISDFATSSRAQFGRGLRGTHFAFGFHANGSDLEIGNIQIEYTNTNRRI